MKLLRCQMSANVEKFPIPFHLKCLCLRPSNLADFGSNQNNNVNLSKQGEINPFSQLEIRKKYLIRMFTWQKPS
jgi:hypothetical protein